MMLSNGDCPTGMIAAIMLPLSHAYLIAALTCLIVYHKRLTSDLSHMPHTKGRRPNLPKQGPSVAGVGRATSVSRRVSPPRDARRLRSLPLNYC